MKLLLLTFTGILILIVVLLSLLFLNDIKKPKPLPEISPSPTTTVIPPTEKMSPYNNASAKKMFYYTKERPTPLLNEDSAIRTKLIENAGNTTKILLKTENVELKYIKSPDTFEAKILTTSVTVAKNEAISYFRNYNLSNDGICKLPLSFYPALSIKNYLLENGIDFNPIPDFCL